MNTGPNPYYPYIKGNIPAGWREILHEVALVKALNNIEGLVSTRAPHIWKERLCGSRCRASSALCDAIPGAEASAFAELGE